METEAPQYQQGRARSGAGPAAPQALTALRRRAGVVALGLALIVLVAACGSSGGATEGVASAGNSKKTTATTAKVDPKQAAVNFARCMREQGVDMPDPTFDDNGDATVGFAPGGGDVQEAGAGDATFTQADKACRHHMDGVAQGGFAKPDAKMQDNALKFARCMRDNGVPNFPDPDFSDGGGVIKVGGEGLDPNSPALESAHKACQSLLGGPPGGSGGSVEVPAPEGGGS